MVRAMDPERVVAIGFGTLSAFGESEAALCNSAGRVLVRKGSIAGYVALGTLHVSGARISAVDRRAMAEYIVATPPGERRAQPNA